MDTEIAPLVYAEHSGCCLYCRTVGFSANDLLRRVVWPLSCFHAGDIGHHYYGPGHPMKPARLKLTHHLILAYGLYRKLEVYKPHLASPEELARFHSDDYIDFLRCVNTRSSQRAFRHG